MKALLSMPGELLKTTEVAAILHRGGSFIGGLADDGRLESHGVPGRQVQRRVITKRSVIVYFAESANYSSPELLALLAGVAATFTKNQFSEFVALAERRRAA